MCGVAGFLHAQWAGSDTEARRALLDMATALRNRGPDGNGIFYNPTQGIGIAHTRLAVIDLSPAGAQPMTSHSGRHTISFNGEIYNHLELRHKLRKESPDVYPFVGRTDTETLIACIDAWGLEATLEQATGMFAFALWDNLTRTLCLVRDRFGEKPMYYARINSNRGDILLFGSDLSAIRAHPQWQGTLSRRSLADYLNRGFVGVREAIYEAHYRVLPGEIVEIRAESLHASRRRWWNTFEMIRRARHNGLSTAPKDPTSELESLLAQVLQEQTTADVPIGAFLSGGIDSTLLVSMMARAAARPINTFTIGFKDRDYDEAPAAKAVAAWLGTNHTECYLGPNDLLAVVPEIPGLYAEPFADSSQIPTVLISKLARASVTVAISGDGGDELFCGYNRYIFASQYLSYLRYTPKPVKQLLAELMRRSPRSFVCYSRGLHGLATLGDKWEKLIRAVNTRTADDLYTALTRNWSDSHTAILNCSAKPDLPSLSTGPALGLSEVECMMATDLIDYLPNDVLTKVDRASMGVGLETRAPYLDFRVAEFAWRLPLSHKLAGRVSKRPLRELLQRLLPAGFNSKQKKGFAVPISDWLRGPLVPWADDLLACKRLREDGLFEVNAIRRKWEEHLSGRRCWAAQLWSVLMFQAWLDSNRDPRLSL